MEKKRWWESAGEKERNEKLLRKKVWGICGHTDHLTEVCIYQYLHGLDEVRFK